ncbi:hypothetical protein M501DRAFT_986279 [Patellaria atrata CBS 101060]|uniref:Uncharacterized protein n=1 Tax=Patellaria atrata CBS 101060 TaxID=1346257 RepID=A0A9P4VRE8_9PEZI|nr:hypothetical protein M501DRAFT_986279 [Patellaria atrata CBS 101060]
MSQYDGWNLNEMKENSDQSLYIQANRRSSGFTSVYQTAPYSTDKFKDPTQRFISTIDKQEQQKLRDPLVASYLRLDDLNGAPKQSSISHHPLSSSQLQSRGNKKRRTKRQCPSPKRTMVDDFHITKPAIAYMTEKHKVEGRDPEPEKHALLLSNEKPLIEVPESTMNKLKSFIYKPQITSIEAVRARKGFGISIYDIVDSESEPETQSTQIVPLSTTPKPRQDSFSHSYGDISHEFEDEIPDDELLDLDPGSAPPSDTFMGEENQSPDDVDLVSQSDILIGKGIRESDGYMDLPTPLPSDPKDGKIASSVCHGAERVDEFLAEDDWVDYNVIDGSNDPHTPEILLSTTPNSAPQGKVVDHSANQNQGRTLRRREGEMELRLTPIVRPAFPSPIRDRSPIIGLSNANLLRTCFRVGEALAAGSQAVRCGRSVILELYANVVSSSRKLDKISQSFVFADLYHNHPPFLSGVCQVWKGFRTNGIAELVHSFDGSYPIFIVKTVFRMVLSKSASRLPEPGSGPSPLAAMLSTQFAIHAQNRQDVPFDGQDKSQEAGLRTPLKSPAKARSLSDSTPQLSPSPKFREPLRKSKDDHTIQDPKTPKRPEFLTRGLSLQMPLKEFGIQNPASYANRVPLSPQLDSRSTYASPASLLPRHSRGLDFSRACTNLHHSTLAESSPDSSPTITQKGMMIPPRTRPNSMSLESPNINGGPLWSSMGDRTAPSSSVGSVNMLGSDSSTSDSDDADLIDGEENEDPMIMTPHVFRPGNVSSAIGAPTISSPSGWPKNISAAPGTASFVWQRSRLRKGRSRKSSSSASGHSSMASPGPASPPQARSQENSGSYFAREIVMKNAGSRRESLTMVTNDLHISSGNDSGDEASAAPPHTPGVIRRHVVRRGNLLPKTRAFSRIKAEMWEESQPVDSEVKREAEIIRQVREGDTNLEPSVINTAQSSPVQFPTIPGSMDPLEDIPEDGSMSLEGQGTNSSSKEMFEAYSLGAANNSGGRGFWNRSESQTRTPPPPSFIHRGASSIMSDDMSIDSPSVPSTSTFQTIVAPQQEPIRDIDQSRSSTPQPAPPSAADGLRKSSKRRRDDDFSGTDFKRRAVSPGMSVQNSPVLSQSPRDLWGQVKPAREPSISVAGERSNSNGSVAVTPIFGAKRVGLQGMTDTNDGLMKMSIE